MTIKSDKTTQQASLLQTWLEEFDEIRGFFDEEVHASVSKLCADDSFINLLADFFTLSHSNVSNVELKSNLKSTVAQLQNITSIEALQSLISTIASPIIDMSVNQLNFTGLDELDCDKHYLFISNHRDILMDPLLLNLLLLRNNHDTAHCAIGDNLLKSPISHEFALLNKCFKILRSLTSPRAILKAMKLQSAYIRHLSFNCSDNIWIAQKEGRSKDNIDKTNPALIKMLGLARPKDMSLGEYVNELNIVPVSISYEWDPCDIDKATELEITEQQGHYNKEAIEDLTAVKKGLLQSKGTVHVHFGHELLNKNIGHMNHIEIADCIDDSIAEHSMSFPVNYAAANALGLTKQIAETFPSKNQASFSKEDIDLATQKLTHRLQNCSEGVRKRVLLNYTAHLGR